jgi:hypothetical protein
MGRAPKVGALGDAKQSLGVLIMMGFGHASRQQLHALLYLLHPCSRTHPAELVAGLFLFKPVYHRSGQILAVDIAFNGHAYNMHNHQHQPAR